MLRACTVIFPDTQINFVGIEASSTHIAIMLIRIVVAHPLPDIPSDSEPKNAKPYWLLLRWSQAKKTALRTVGWFIIRILLYWWIKSAFKPYNSKFIMTSFFLPFCDKDYIDITFCEKESCENKNGFEIFESGLMIFLILILSQINRIAEDPATPSTQIAPISLDPIYARLSGDMGANQLFFPLLDDLTILDQTGLSERREMGL